MKEKSKKILGIHFGLILGETICILAFYVEYRRAAGGNTLSWAYVVEWPIFAFYIIYMWRRLLREEKAPLTSTIAHIKEPDDPALIAMNEYLRAVHGLPTVSEESSPVEAPQDRVT